MQTNAIPTITAGNWTFAQEDGGVDPALSYNGVEFRAGHTLDSKELRLAALDLMKLAAAVASSGF
jgi:hypothetical protein